jgi:hypothetical protein
MVFKKTGQKYQGILTLEKGGTMANYRNILKHWPLMPCDNWYTNSQP